MAVGSDGFLLINQMWERAGNTWSEEQVSEFNLTTLLLTAVPVETLSQNLLLHLPRFS